MKATRLMKAMAGLAVAGGAVVLTVGSASAWVPVVGSSALRPPTPIGAIEPQNTGPTPDLTKVENNVSYRDKSVTTVISVPAGLSLSRPVTISVGYGNGARITQDYVASTGNRFLYNYPVGDGFAHQQTVSITMTQPNPSGGQYLVNLQWEPMIEPLYDVSFSPLTFTLLNDCALIGNSDVILDWTDTSQAARQSWFSLSAGQEHVVSEFAGTLSQVANSSNYWQPIVRDFIDQPNGWGTIFPPFVPGEAYVPPVKLVPGSTSTVSFNVNNSMSGCLGYVQYTQTYTLDWYPYL